MRRLKKKPPVDVCASKAKHTRLQPVAAAQKTKASRAVEIASLSGFKPVSPIYH
jgi:hypothetical protein